MNHFTRSRALYYLGSLFFAISVVFYVVVPRSVHRFVSAATPHTTAPDFDYPVSGPAETFFPIDLVVSYNYTDGSGIEELYERRARYAAFSPILSDTLRSKYAIWPDDACEPIMPLETESEARDKAIIVLRGNCTFTTKIRNVLDLRLNPSAIIIANDEPQRGLITMFSKRLNEDESLKIPILFINNEDFVVYYEFKNRNLTLFFETASLGGWFSLVLSLIFSPPILILSCYLILFLSLRVQKIVASRLNTKLVKSLPVYCFNNDHLIETKYLDNYLKATNQTVRLAGENSVKTTRSDRGLSLSLNKIMVNGVDIRARAKDLHVLTAPEDFFPAFKCSICLENYVPLESSVLIPNCKHFYHEKCLANWLINFRKSCPLCNRTIRITDVMDSSPALEETRHLLPGGPTYSAIVPDLEAQVPLIGNSLSNDRATDIDTVHQDTPPHSVTVPEVLRPPSTLMSDERESFMSTACWTSPQPFFPSTTPQVSISSVRLCEFLTPQLTIGATPIGSPTPPPNAVERLSSDSTLHITRECTI